MRNENSRRLGIVLSISMIILLGSSSLAFAGDSHKRKKNSFRKVIKSFFGKRYRCRSPKDGQVISWHTRGSHWHPREYSCRDHKAPNGVSNGDKLTWSDSYNDWVEDYIRVEEVDANLVVSGFIQSLSTGFIFPDGSIHTTASAGVAGPVGIQGEPGLNGQDGDAGLQGEAGQNGEPGLQGEQGIQGPAGQKGDQGIQGLSGAAGIKGDQGIQGLAGVQGAKGEQGIKGLAGVNGAAGAIGLSGDQGPQGIAGEQGPKGDKGSVGPVGSAGIKGDQGIQGPVGVNGALGPQGLIGQQGPKGLDASVEITAGVGLVAGVISSVGTINIDVGISAGQIPQLDSQGRLPASVLPAGSGAGSSSKIAYIKDVRPSGTSGGTCTSGAWQTRTLNTVEGDSTIVALAGNSFTLQPGTYHISGNAPAFVTSQHQAKIVDAGAGTDAIVGSTGFSHNTSPSITQSLIAGVLTLSAPRSFSLLHRCASTHAIGFGLAAGFGSNETYSQLRITKVE
jgi:hypothetical protein